MFNSKLNIKPAAPDGLSARALNASTAAAHNAQIAAQSAAQAAQAAAQSAAAGMGSAAQSAAQEMGKSMRQGVFTARGWAAPRLEHAADYTTAEVAPRVAGALRSTARQVSPKGAGGRRPSLRSALSVSVFAIATFAALGAVAALVRRRYKAAMEADTESDVVDIEDGDEPGAAHASAASNGSALVTDDTETGASATGRTSTSGW